jgi:hypothetical protein
MKLACNVVHDGKDFPAGSECPKELEKLFLENGFLVEEKETPKKEKKGK